MKISIGVSFVIATLLVSHLNASPTNNRYVARSIASSSLERAPSTIDGYIGHQASVPRDYPDTRQPQQFQDPLPARSGFLGKLKGHVTGLLPTAFRRDRPAVVATASKQTTAYDAGTMQQRQGVIQSMPIHTGPGAGQPRVPGIRGSVFTAQNKQLHDRQMASAAPPHHANHGNLHAWTAQAATQATTQAAAQSNPKIVVIPGPEVNDREKRLRDRRMAASGANQGTAQASTAQAAAPSQPKVLVLPGSGLKNDRRLASAAAPLQTNQGMPQVSTVQAGASDQPKVLVFPGSGLAGRNGRYPRTLQANQGDHPSSHIQAAAPGQAQSNVYPEIWPTFPDRTLASAAVPSYANQGNHQSSSTVQAAAPGQAQSNVYPEIWPTIPDSTLAGTAQSPETSHSADARVPTSNLRAPIQNGNAFVYGTSSRIGADPRARTRVKYEQDQANQAAVAATPVDQPSVPAARRFRQNQGGHTMSSTVVWDAPKNGPTDDKRSPSPTGSDLSSYHSM
jgi:hypothetical protein